VRVYLDNRMAGRTDSDGRLLLPSLRPYEDNRVRLDVQDLPLDAEITTAEVEAVPYDRSGMTIAFPLERAAQATATLLGADGESLPIGLRLRSADGRVTAWVARDGFSEVRGAGTVPALVTAEIGDRLVSCPLPAAPPDEILADLGVVRCR
jgi:outer membrane usher protein